MYTSCTIVQRYTGRLFPGSCLDCADCQSKQETRDERGGEEYESDANGEQREKEERERDAFHHHHCHYEDHQRPVMDRSPLTHVSI